MLKCLLNESEICYKNVALYGLILLLCLCQVACSAKTQIYDEPRLPPNVKPFHYDIRLLTHLESSANCSYNGIVKISIHAQKTTNQVVLHVGRVSIESKKITLFGETSNYRLRSVRFNKDRKYMEVTFNQSLLMGKSYVLSVEFGRSMSMNQTDGYFIRYYINWKTSQKIWYSVSHFNRNWIRNTMPSFDEPSLKATFNVTMGHHKRFQSYGNMKVQAVLPNHEIQDYVWSVHEVTPTIPTHLLAFSVNNFTCRYSQAASMNPVRFRTCVQSADVRATSFAAQMAPQILEFLDRVLQVSLPLEKIDQLVVDDFPTEAMENFGLVVYSSKQLLQREDGQMTKEKLQTLHLIAHELAHMWFDNLLGMDSYSDLWLTEGLAGYFKSLAVDHLQSRTGRRILLRYRESSMMYESQVGGISLVPLSSNASLNAERQLYQKATSLICMLIGFLGNETFYDGLQRHMWQNSFGSSTPDLFWRSLQLASEREATFVKMWDVKSIMDTWIMQSGYPLVTVIRNGSEVFLKQGHALNRSSSQLWWIPLTYLIEGGSLSKNLKPKAWLSPNSHSIKLNDIVPRNQWILLNLQAVGYYRVNYDELTWQLLATTLFNDFRSINVINRAQIVSDVLFLWNQKLLAWSTALNVLKYIIDEDEYEPLMAFVVGWTNGFCGISAENSFNIAKWLGIAAKWYAEFISYTFDKFVVQDPNQNLNSLDYPD
ncbi:aminopeptidase Q [Drosophila simulans]|uniref:Aminopeptidase n=2 Tax=Drosophila simulans TaxID=7240 RepID=A0A0J9R3V6_DROSI|nr:aminopeptidase Q [Drosophila simulans]KMY90419.1 uncharacterized protein Dsimw501_GD21935 [Drosophila simulans]